MLDWKDIVDGDEIIPDDINLVANELIKTQKEIKKSIPEKQPLDFVVNVTTTGSNYETVIESTDKTFEEVLEAHNAGKRVYLLVNKKEIVPMTDIDTSRAIFARIGYAGEKTLQFDVSQSGWFVSPAPDPTYLEIEEMIRNGDDAVRTELGNVLNGIVNGTEQPLNLIKTITLTEGVTSIETTFEKPMKEIYMVFTGTLDGITDDVSDCIISAKCDGGSQYLFYKAALKFAPNTNKAYIAHAKEIVERRWETEFAGNTLGIGASGILQGLDASSANPRTSYSARLLSLPRHIDNLTFSIYNAKYSFAIGSTLEIYGVEVDE
jgi:hypothetical protein